MAKPIATKFTESEHTYKVECDGISCTSRIPYLGYAYDQLKNLEEAKFRLFIDGKRSKYPTAAEYKAATR